MIDIIKHHIPELKQTSTKFVYVAKYCPFCKYSKTNSNIFRVNLKLKVFKCYNCGRSGKDVNKFIHLIKEQKKNGYKIFRYKSKVRTFEVYYGCETYYESTLPF